MACLIMIFEVSPDLVVCAKIDFHWILNLPPPGKVQEN